MNRGKRSYIIMLLFLFILQRQELTAQDNKFTEPVKGVAETLAKQREKSISNINYALTFNIPSAISEGINGEEVISFNWKKESLPLQLDFKEKEESLISILANGKAVPAHITNEHIVIPASYLKPGVNSISIHFKAGELSLNRNPDFLYTLLVPDRARTLFPCFDQPGLKARYKLTLVVPGDWNALANAPIKDSLITGSRKTYHYKESDIFSTYLFSFVAGKFNSHTKSIKGRSFNFLYRETETSKLRYSLDSIFGLHASALNYLENYTGIKFPFQKMDFAGIPDFQYGGMEHVGAIDYKASSLFLDPGATKDQENARSNVIAHETAHMWFGDLVTMQWFNDVWMKEVFANFIADKATQGNQPGSNYELKFVTTHFPRAYAVDRTSGANAIRQQLPNLNEAGNLYGAVIYNKAPVMMRQLERLMGASSFRDGLREYLRKYSYRNATWPDLISILDKRTSSDLQVWNKVWVNTPGRPELNYSLHENGGKIVNLTITQNGEQSADYMLPQFFEIALVYPNKIEELTVNMNQKTVVVKEAEGKVIPSFILYNSSGQGYGLFPIEKATSFSYLKSPVMRASAYITLYENMLSGRFIKPSELLQLYMQEVKEEPEELNLSLITGYIGDIYWRLLLSNQRTSTAGSLESALWNALRTEAAPNKKKILYRTFQNIASSKSALDTLYAVWKDQKPPTGVRLSEDDYISLALNLAVKEYPADSILQTQLSRISNADRRARLQFIIPAVSPDVKIRDAFFASLQDQKTRKKEAWVVDALAYLHHPLRTSTSIKYLRQSLDMLQEIQQTGDIFFPGAWLGLTLGSYNSKEAADILRAFLQANPSYNKQLKMKILQATDPLLRAEKLLQPQL